VKHPAISDSLIRHISFETTVCRGGTERLRVRLAIQTILYIHHLISTRTIPATKISENIPNRSLVYMFRVLHKVGSTWMSKHLPGKTRLECQPEYVGIANGTDRWRSGQCARKGSIVIVLGVGMRCSDREGPKNIILTTYKRSLGRERVKRSLSA
jgi:hypothetical protein